MKVAFGLKAHSGWAAMIVIGQRGGEPKVLERRRIELVGDAWTKQPYHAAEHLEAEAGRELVKRGIEAIQNVALREMQLAVQREQQRDNQIAACAVLVGDPMPDWSTGQILAVHIRMHRAEGVLFRNVLLRAARECGLRTLPIPEKQLTQCAQQALGDALGNVIEQLDAIGKTLGPPWRKDQKDAALAGVLALRRGALRIGIARS